MEKENGKTNQINRSFPGGGLIALYRRSQNGAGQLVSVLNLALPEKQPSVKFIGIITLQKLERVLRVMNFDTVFVHFGNDITPPETLLDFDTILQTTPQFWDCECRDGDYIHEASDSQTGICPRCRSEEIECADSRIDEVFRKMRLNFSRWKPCKVWRRDDQSGQREFFLGGFSTRAEAEEAIAGFQYHNNRLDETICEDYKTEYQLSRAFINPQIWEVLGDK